MISINIKTIPHKEQRCDGNVGDYWLENSGQELQVRVSMLGDWRYEVLVAIHEVIEFYLCHAKGIKENDIQAFDEEYYRQEDLGVISGYPEAGADPRAPYHLQHMIADGIERIIAVLLGVNWKEYEEAIDKLFEEKIDIEKPFRPGKDIPLIYPEIF